MHGLPLPGVRLSSSPCCYDAGTFFPTADHLSLRGGKFVKRWNRKQDHQLDHHHEQRLGAIRNELAEELEELTAAADVNADTTPPTYASA